MFCNISKNWRGRPPETREALVNLIGAITTGEGLRIRAELDSRTYKTGVRGPDKAFAQIPFDSSTLHGEWNYTVLPSGSRSGSLVTAPNAQNTKTPPSSSGAWSGCVANSEGECSYTLKRKFRISPSSTTYVFPSTRSFPCSLTFCSLPARMNSSYFITSARINPLSMSE